MTKPPAVGQDLLDWLDGQFPDSLPEPIGTSEHLLHQLLRKQGHREVIKHLESLVTRQEKAALRTIL